MVFAVKGFLRLIVAQGDVLKDLLHRAGLAQPLGFGVILFQIKSSSIVSVRKYLWSFDLCANESKFRARKGEVSSPVVVQSESCGSCSKQANTARRMAFEAEVSLACIRVVHWTLRMKITL